jgi:drug/metabolite transporter (DMT)-like permease
VAALVLVTSVWGATFVIVQDASGRMGVYDFLAWRFSLAALVLAAVRPRSLRRVRRRDARRGALLGLVLGAGYVGQTLGLQYTSAAVSGFVTGMFVVFTPLIAALLLRRPIAPAAWAGVVVATAGLALISLRGLAVGPGELLTLACALCFAVHIIGLGEWSCGSDPYPLTVLQLGTVGLACTAAAGPGGLAWPTGQADWLAIGITAVLATSAGFFLQTWAQAHLSPVRVAVVMTMEPVFAGVSAVVAGQRLTPRILAGGTLVVAAMYLVELGPRRSTDAPPDVSPAGPVTHD